MEENTVFLELEEYPGYVRCPRCLRFVTDEELERFNGICEECYNSN